MLNIAALMGRLVADPELKHTSSNIAVCSFRIAVDRNIADSSGERKADFIDIVAWRNAAEFVCKYFTKGQMIAVNGRIQTRNYEDKNGNKRTAVEVVAENVNFCGSKQESGQGQTKQAGVGYWNQGSSNASQVQEPQGKPQSDFSQQSFEQLDDPFVDEDLPF